MSEKKTPKYIKLDERHHVEKPLLYQLAGLGWDVIDLDNKQDPVDRYRENFTEGRYEQFWAFTGMSPRERSGGVWQTLKTDILAQSFVIHSVAERDIIASSLDTQEKRLEDEAEYLAKHHSLKTALMKDALTGKVMVTPLRNKTEVSA